MFNVAVRQSNRSDFFWTNVNVLIGDCTVDENYIDDSVVHYRTDLNDYKSHSANFSTRLNRYTNCDIVYYTDGFEDFNSLVIVLNRHADFANQIDFFFASVIVHVTRVTHFADFIVHVANWVTIVEIAVNYNVYFYIAVVIFGTPIYEFLNHSVSLFYRYFDSTLTNFRNSLMVS